MQKKRVGVITFHNYDNYGAILQSYELQKKLQEIGTQPEIINFRLGAYFLQLFLKRVAL